MRQGFVCVAILVLLAASPAFAAFHLMVIQEVFVGDPPDGVGGPLRPDERAQYVMLRMTGSGQTFTGKTSLRVEDADGNLLGAFGMILDSVANGGSFSCAYPTCPAIMVGTTRADDLFTFSFDQDVTGQDPRVALPGAGGRVCFVSGSSVIDCVAWGNFDCRRSGNCKVCSNIPTQSCATSGECGAGTCDPKANVLRTGDFSGNGCDVDFGAPAAASGIDYGRTLTRTSFNCTAKENSTQFTISYPHPVNNAAQNNNPDSDGDGLVNVLDCDDANAAFRWPVADLQNLRAVPGPSFQYSQAAVSGTGVTYDVVCGSLGSLNGFSDASCAANDDTTGALPVPGGDLVYCLARASSSVACGGTGTYGAGRSAIDNVCTPP